MHQAQSSYENMSKNKAHCQDSPNDTRILCEAHFNQVPDLDNCSVWGDPFPISQSGWVLLPQIKAY